MITGLREWAYRRRLLKPVELPAFVASVGNLSMGGTGKSALVMLLSEWAAQRRIPTVVLSRGYKRKTKALKIVAPGERLPHASEIGDEPWMIKHRVPQVALLVHPDRARMAARHWSELGAPRLVILDDAFQHWRVSRNTDILMIDATESLEQRALPFGRLRETIRSVRRADLVVLTRANAVSAEALTRLEWQLREASEPRAQPVWKRQIRPRLLVVAADYECSAILDAASGKIVSPVPPLEFLLVSGIAKPDHLRTVAQRAGVPVVEELYFPDHHSLTSADKKQIRQALGGLRNGALLFTEKDWGRWQELVTEGLPAYVLQVRFRFLHEGEAVFRGFLEEIGKEAAACSILP